MTVLIIAVCLTLLTIIAVATILAIRDNTLSMRNKDHWRNALDDRCPDPRGEWTGTLVTLPTEILGTKMNDPILPDLPAGFYLATEDEGCPKVYERQDGRWYSDQGDPRVRPWHGCTLHSIPALIDAARERDAMRAVLIDIEKHMDERSGGCPVCRFYLVSGHHPSCALAAVLGKKPPTPTRQEKS